MSLKWLVALTENVKGREKTDFLSQTVISERAGPGCLKGWLVDLEGSVQWQIQGSQWSQCPWDPRGPHCSPCLLKQCCFNCWLPGAEQPSFLQMDRPFTPREAKKQEPKLKEYPGSGCPSSSVFQHLSLKWLYIYKELQNTTERGLMYSHVLRERSHCLASPKVMLYMTIV